MAMKQSTIDKHKLVVDEWFVNGFNGTKSYQNFYPVEDHIAAVEFKRILRNPKIQEYKTAKHSEAREILGTSHIEVLNELNNWLYADITELIGVAPEEIKNLPIEVRRLITEFEHTTTTFDGRTTDKIKLKFVSKEKAIDIVTKHIAFFEKDNLQQNPSPVIKAKVKFVRKRK